MARPFSSSTTERGTIRRRTAGAAGRVLLAGGLASLVLALVLPPVGEAHADDTSNNTLSLVSQTEWVRTTKGMRIEVAVSSHLPLSQLALVVTVYSEVTERGYFEETIAGDTSDFTPLQTSPPLKLTGRKLHQANGDFLLDFPVAPPAVPGKALAAPSNGAVVTLPCTASCAGVYPVQVSLESLSSFTPLDSFMTYMVIAPAAVPSPLRFSLVVPVGAAPSYSTSGSPAPSGAVEHEVADLLSLATTDPSVHLTLALYPEVLDALSEAAAVRTPAGKKGAGRAPPSAKRATVALGEARALLALPNVEVLDETYSDVDLSGLSASKLGAEAAGQFSAGRAALSSFGADLRGAPYASSVGLGPGGLDLAHQSGVRRVIVPSYSSAPVPLSWEYPVWAPSFEPGTTTEIETSDPFLEQHLSSSVDAPLKASQILADLAVLYFVEQPPGNRGVSLLAPAGWIPSSSFLSTLLGGLASSPVVESVTLRQYFSEVPVASAEIPDGAAVSPLFYRAVVTEKVPLDDLLAGRPLASAHRILNTLATVTPGATRMLGRLEHLVYVGETAGMGRAKRAAYFEAPAKEIGALQSRLSLPRKRTITITSLTAKVPISVYSRASVPLDVRLDIASCPLPLGPDGCHNGDLSFRHHVVELPSLTPGNHTVEVHVSARSSGDFYLYMALTSPDGAIVLASSKMTIRSTAISGVAIVLTVLAAAFLLLWWGRSALKRRGRHARGDVTGDGPSESLPAT